MGLLHGIAELVAPTRCAGCEMPGALLCEPCDDGLPRVALAQACPRCGAPFGALVCTECWSTRYAFEAVLALGELDGALARAVVLHKDAGERRLGHVLGAMLAREVVQAWPAWAEVVTWIPPTREAIARRGFDHGKALAAPVGVALGAATAPLLARALARDQRVLGRAARASNAAGSFSASGHVPERVIVVDDVLTTGATLDAAAATLLEAGAAEVRAAVIARAW